MKRKPRLPLTLTLLVGLVFPPAAAAQAKTNEGAKPKSNPADDSSPQEAKPASPAGEEKPGGTAETLKKRAEEAAKENNLETHLTGEAIQFAKGSSELTQKARSRLRAMVQQLQKQGKIQRMRIAAWSDRDFPSKDQRALPEEQQQLAEHRGAAVNDFLRTQDEKLPIETYNMAEKANYFAEVFNTSEAELKSVFAKKVNDDQALELAQEGRLLKEKGAPRAVVVIASYRMAAPEGKAKPQVTPAAENSQSSQSP